MSDFTCLSEIRCFYPNYVARIYMNKGENMPVFLFDVIEPNICRQAIYA